MIYVNLSGGLGNQMFEYAFGRALQLANPDQHLILNTFHFSNQGHNHYSLDKFTLNEAVVIQNAGRYGQINYLQKIALKITNRIGSFLQSGLDTQKRYRFESAFERLLNFINIYFERSGNVPVNQHISKIFKNTLTSGYWQSYEYFDKYRPTLLKEFAPKFKLDQEVSSFIDFAQSCETVCLHIRRGDYVGHQLHYVCTPEYYLQAVKKMKQLLVDKVFIVFSDDIEWVKDSFSFNNNFIYPPQCNSSTEELLMMSACRNFIISNSSFSWWAQYLCQNDKKIVLAPSRWYNADYPTGVYMKNWQLIHV